MGTVQNFSNDGKLKLLTAAGPGGGGFVHVVTADGLRLSSIDVFSTPPNGGVFVGG